MYALGEEIAGMSAHIDSATHRMLESIRRFDQGGGWHEQGAASCAHWLAWRLGLDSSTAREKVRVARALGSLPAIDDAFRRAALSYSKVRALTRVATPQNEAALLEMALVATGAQLERLCRRYRTAAATLEGEQWESEKAPEARSVRRRELAGGMVRLELVLAPDEAELVLRAIQRAREVEAAQGDGAEQTDQGEAQEAPAAESADGSAEAPWPSAADGALRVAESFLAGHPVSGSGGERFQVMVHLDQEALAADGRWAATLEDGTAVSAEALRRVACDCALLAAGGNGENLNIGRRSRSIPPALRRALMVRDGGCAFPGCRHIHFLHGHHIEHWLHGGQTRLDNVLLLCTHHHALVHEGGWSISRSADRAFLFHAPGGAVLAPNPRPPQPVQDIAGWMREWAEQNNLDLGPDVNMPQWDGSRPDYKLAVSCLLEPC